MFNYKFFSKSRINALLIKGKEGNLSLQYRNTYIVDNQVIEVISFKERSLLIEYFYIIYKVNNNWNYFNRYIVDSNKSNSNKIACREVNYYIPAFNIWNK